MATPAWPDRFLQALPNTGTISGAAKVAGVGRRTVYDEMDRNPDFKADVQAILAECVEAAETTLFQAAQLAVVSPAHTTALIFYLKNRKPEVYGDKIRPEQLEAIRAQLLRELQAQLEEEIAQLTPQARGIVMRAMRQAAERRAELTA